VRRIWARSNGHEPEILISHVKEIPAWNSVAPWDEGYGLARDILDELDPRPDSEKTEIETIIRTLGIKTVDENFGVDGPRGVAIAGPGYSPTILINCEHLMNTEPSGIRFTLAHELCHLLFDREKARPIVHASTPWAERAVEQRANAFAAMLLMPLDRLTLQADSEDVESLQSDVRRLTRKLEVSRTALIRHLANISKISGAAMETLLARP
jgi:Zn-dependent peptidase ImmA (M78 family)